MAVEVNNKRKRKHDESAPQEDEGAEVVPKKQTKKSTTPKKEKTKKQNLNNSSEAMEDSPQDSGFDTEDKEIKFSKDFKMMEFRTKLRGDNFITELRHFLYLCQSRPQTIAKYIEKRGKPLEFAEALERVDKTNILHIAYICEALQLVVMEILSNQRNHMESAVHASRYFLKSHGTLLELLLKSAQLNHRKVALKLLTAIVCVEPQLGRQVLASYDILSNVKNINQFLSHSQFELQQQQKQQHQQQHKFDEDFETVRKCFIHFVLAYLVDGNTLLIRNILDRGSLIRALAAGLSYDDSVTVCVVLSTLKKYVLECPDISKTKKIHVFDLDCCKSFIQLYDWKGPRVFAAKHAGKKGALKNVSGAEMEHLINPQEKEAVSKAVHEFLLVLLTSRKFGIAFDTVKFFRQKHNTIQGQIMGYMHNPYSDERKTDLVLKILESCPDLFRNSVRNFAGIINPLRTANRYWLNAAEFLRKVITACHPSHLKGALDKITLTDFSFWIKDICLPLETLVHINGNKFLLHKDFEQRLATNRLLLAMFQQYTNYMQIINQREQNKNSNSLRRFKFDILNHLLMNFPTMENILLSLNMSITLKEQEGVDVLAHLDVALDLVLILCQENRTFVNKTSVILDYLELLRPLYAQEEDQEIAREAEIKTNIKLEMKAIKTILLLFPKALEPQKERFSSVLRSFIKAFVYGEEDVSREAGALLRNIFKNTGIFETGELEIDLWLEPLKFVHVETVNVVAQVFNEVLKVTKAEVEMPKSIGMLASNTDNLHTLFSNIEQGLSVQAYVETLTISKLMPLIYKGVDIEPPLSKYLEIVCFLMYHYYPSAESVMMLYAQHFKTMLPYMQNWLSKEPCEEILLYVDNKSAKIIPYLKEIASMARNGQKDFEQIFESNSQENVYEMEFKGNMKKFSRIIQNPRLLMIYIQHVLFQVQQLQLKQMLSQEKAEKCADFIKICIDMILCFPAQEDTPLKDENDSLNNELFIHKLLKYIFGARLHAIKSNELLSVDFIHDSFKNYLLFLNLLTEHCHSLENFDLYAENFKLKLVKAVAISLNHKEQVKVNSQHFEEFLKLFKSFHLTAEQCHDILNLLVDNLTYKDFFLMDNNNQKTIYYSLMVSVLQRLADLKKSIKCLEFIKKFSKIYCNFFKKLTGDFNVELLEESFYNFLIINHQFIALLDSKFFESFFKERKLTKSCIKLAALVFERNDAYNQVFKENLELNMDKKELMYPLMDLAFKKLNLAIDSNTLQKVYQNYKNGFMRTIEKPLKAGMIYKEHVDTSLKLIELCMPLTECKDFCNKQFKFEHIETYQLRTIYKIYEKAFLNNELKQKSLIFVNYIMLQVQMLSLDLKMQKLNEEKLSIISYQMQEWFKFGWNLSKSLELEEKAIEDAKALEFLPDFSKLLKSQQWLQFCKSCLKTGMHINETDVELDINDKFNGLLLKLLAYLADNLYNDYTEDCADSTANAECAQLYEMIFTHSKFYDIVLNKPSQSKVKTQVLHLLYIMAKKSPSSLQEPQIPVILGAYQAKLYDSDRYCLALLNLYEYYDCGLAKYRPFIWGESAIAFYALKAADEERAKLTQQETSIQQVMSLVDRQLCEYTIDNFPIWRKLDTLQQLPLEEFENPFLKAWQFGANSLEQKLELGITQITENEMRLCPKRSDIYEQCYDPAFFVPLMSMCFSNEAYAHPARPVQNGLLALTFAALSSQDKEMRQAAGCVQLRYRSHFENNKFFEKPLWIQTYENLQSGLNDLRNSWMKHKSNSGTPRVPYISGLFVAKTFNLTTDPTHLLYKQLTMFLRLKSSFNFQCIPEFNVLFYSPEMEHQEFRQFIVEVIKHGIKSSSDLFLLVSTNTFKVLMGFYGSTMSTLELNLQILSVFSTCVKIPASSKIMLEHIGLIPWLSSIINSIEFYQFDVIEGLISIINNLWYAVKANEKEFHNFSHISLEIHRLILQLIPLISPRISSNNFAKLMNILNKTCLNSSQYLAMSSDQLGKLISCAEKHYSTLILPLQSIYENGGMGCSSWQSYCQELYSQQVDSKTILALNSLRSYIISWWSSHNDQQIVEENSSTVIKC
ncbi:hypothetical protein FF38_09866 [Lucilia cuprina]|uniref:Nucleolar pre-ribosomal-associated protein 1 n=1 Tax=Lucilia cuprina TaxID=7375 RepID=A0A0L0CM45_LUCCU|nr:hypothetical protein FF38_09866 [Lucilia cuprina]